MIVPFAGQLAEALAGQPTEPRVGRDFARLLSLVKAAALLRHRRRSTDEKDRLLAEAADYELVYELAAEVYRSSASGAGEKVLRWSLRWSASPPRASRTSRSARWPASLA